MATLVLKATQEADLAFTVKDAKGNAASFEGTPAWASSDPQVEVIAAADGLTAKVRAVGSLVGDDEANAQVSVTVDGDTGEGTRLLVGLLEVQVIPGDAVIVELSAGAPTEQA